jgi:hypothetical protein
MIKKTWKPITMEARKTEKRQQKENAILTLLPPGKAGTL